MEDIEIPMTIGDRKTKVILSCATGGTNGAHIYIDKFYHGKVCKMSDGWHVYLNRNSILSPEDCEIIKQAVMKPVETIIESEINGVKVKIDHFIDTLDDEDVYTGCYRARFDDGRIIKVELNDDAVWIETGGEATELAKKIGELIENYSE